MKQSTLFKTSLRGIGPLVVLALVGVTLGLVAMMGPRFGSYTYSHSDFPDSFTAEHLTGKVDVIVRGIFIDEMKEVIPSISPVDGRPDGSLTELYRRFQVIESLQGKVKEGQDIFTLETIEVADGGVSQPPFVRKIQPIALTRGQEYFLFLRGRPRPDGYPANYGDTLWARFGEPGAASVVGDDLLFLATERYRSMVQQRGLALPVKGSVAPFTMTLPELRALVAERERNGTPSSASPDRAPGEMDDIKRTILEQQGLQ